MLLTKTDLMAMLQCPRQLWLMKNSPLSSDTDPAAERRQNEGRMVGGLANRLLGPEIVWPNSDDDKRLAAKLAMDQLVENPGRPAVEVPLYYEELYSRADALIPAEDGYVLRETKASSFPLKKDKTTPDKAESHHLEDIAIQAWVMENSGIPMIRAELNLINNQWAYPGDNNYEGFFRQKDVTEDVRGMQQLVPLWLAQAQQVVSGDMPPSCTGKQCNKPHACLYQSYCETLDPPKPEHPIELLPDLAGKNLAKKLRETQGYVSLLEPAPHEFTGTNAALYVRMQEAHRTGQAYLDPDSGALLQNLPYPRYYFDFETIDLAIPQWQGVRPYEQIPFQWSCHIEREAGVFEHAEFIDFTGQDPSLGCIHRLLEVIDPNDHGPIFVYFATFERCRLQELAKRHPEYAEPLLRYADRLEDLLPVVKNNFYHPAMEGSFSIKKVLPVIAPDLDYGELSEIQEGVGAQLAYIRLALDPGVSEEQKAMTLENARKYCRQDTWAMVEVAYFLQHLGRPVRPEGM